MKKLCLIFSSFIVLFFHEQVITARDQDDYPRDMSYLTVLAPLNLRTFNAILDIGCGSGAITHHIALRTPGLVTGVDMSQEIINQAKKKYLADNLSFVAHDICNWSMPKNCYDLIVSINCLHWIENAQAIVNTVARSLKRGGEFVAAVQDKNHYLYKPMLEVSKKPFWREQFGSCAESPWYPQTYESLKNILEQAGLQIISLFTWHRQLSFKSAEIFNKWLASWIDYVPHVATLPTSLKGNFISEVADNFLASLEINQDGSFIFTTPVLIVHAKKD